MESNCCGAWVDTDVLICGDCKEHCDAIDVEKYNELMDRLWYYRDICFSENSNASFDELHDDLIAQVMGFEAEDDLEDVEKMVDQIESYYEATQLVNEHNIDFIYA